MLVAHASYLRSPLLSANIRSSAEPGINWAAFDGATRFM
jgi:hypothetical protein